MSLSAVRSITVAARGKGAANLVRRARAVGRHYGIGPGKMERRLASVLEIVERHHCRATLPVTAAAVRRNPDVIARYAGLGIEFAVHGLHHVDHAGLTAIEQIEQLRRARSILESSGVPVVGFRAPYLRWNEGTLHALRENGFLYDSSQAMNWLVDVEAEGDGYGRALTFYGALSANEHVALPQMDGGIVRIPCSIPDDEAAIDRLGLTTPEALTGLWLDVFRRSHQRGELFTLAVHPERIELCELAIDAVLNEAREAPAGVWIARLDELARWWRDRSNTTVTVHDRAEGYLQVDLRGPDGLVVFARGVDVSGAEPMGDGTVRVHRRRFDVRTPVRPFVGVHPSSSGRVIAFLREQGFVVELTGSPDGYGAFVHRERFTTDDELPLLRELDDGGSPFLRLGRWPGGARSALSVTGDVDALTILDYASRLLGR